MELLCGDIGGTKTLLQRVAVADDTIEVMAEQRFTSGDYASFDLILRDFLARQPNPDAIAAACFGVAGPVAQAGASQKASTTNLPWHMDSAELATCFNLPKVALINDFEAIGHGITALPESDFVTLQAGQPIEQGNRLVIGAGTGLGVAQMIWSGGDYRIMPAEGGHADFAPADVGQLKLAEWVMRSRGRCAVEFVVSGPGLVNIFSCLAESQQQLNSQQYRAIMQAPDPAAAIAAAADEDGATLASQAMELLVAAYGGQTGNFALACLPRGGVYVAGGIAAKITHRLQEGKFIEAFNAKGKMAQLMLRMPVKVITNPAVGLIGSRVYAEKLVAL